MRSDRTSIAVASISPRIWASDKATWQAWYASLTCSTTTKQFYKRVIAEFYYSVEIPITSVTEQDIYEYVEILKTGRAVSTAKQHGSIIRAYWRFAQKRELIANNLSTFFAHITENLKLVEDGLEQDLSEIEEIEFGPQVNGNGWWIEANLRPGSWWKTCELIVWVSRRNHQLEVEFSDYRAE